MLSESEYLDRARSAGVSESDISRFLSQNPGDAHRLAEAFGLPAGSGDTSQSSHTQFPPAITSRPAAAVLPSVQAPGSNAAPLSTVSSNSVATGIAIVNPAPMAGARVLTMPAPESPEWCEMYRRGEIQTLVAPNCAAVPPLVIPTPEPLPAAVTSVGAPGGGTPATVPAPTASAPVVQAQLLAGVDNQTLLLVAAAVVVLLLMSK